MMMMKSSFESLTIMQGDALEKLCELPGESVQCCVTSPPYWGLRDYGTAAWEGGVNGCDHVAPAGVSGGQRADRTFTLGEIYKTECGKCGARRIDSQLGLERTPEEYVAKMVEVFREVRRVLRRDGTLWLNLGDSYANGLGGPPSSSSTLNGGRGVGPNEKVAQLKPLRKGTAEGLKPKDLCGIPWRVAFALQADGWWLRSDIIWAKPNPMPESVTDRCTKSHEYLFMLTKCANYYFDAEAIKENVSESQEGRIRNDIIGGSSWKERQQHGQGGTYARRKPSGEMALFGECSHSVGQNGTSREAICQGSEVARQDESTSGQGLNSRNKRSVWTVATAPYPEAHFATYPPDLIKPCIMAGTSAKGCCARCGAPWERVVEQPFKGDGNPHNYDERLTFGNKMRMSGAQLAAWNEANPAKTLGWQPTCRCDAAVVPCVCLDPFAGSGTTGAVALELGRRAVMIELNPKYVALIEQRCTTTMGLALA